jgi:riboflavin synthase
LSSPDGLSLRDSGAKWLSDNCAMFTGIITGVGHIRSTHALSGAAYAGRRVWVEAPAGYLSDVGLGDSIAINGACMTVTELADAQFSFDVSSESLDKTSGLDEVGPVNLEKALRAGDRLGGHIVSGHVDGVGEVTAFDAVGNEWRDLSIRCAKDLGRFLAYKGSITVNGVSLTVNTVRDADAGCEFSIRLIPHTLQNTSLHTLQAGSKLNLEVDTVARYVERMLNAPK